MTTMNALNTETDQEEFLTAMQLDTKSNPMRQIQF